MATIPHSKLLARDREGAIGAVPDKHIGTTGSDVHLAIGEIIGKDLEKREEQHVSLRAS